MNFAVTFRILQSYFESCFHVIADFEKLQSHFEGCSHVIADFQSCSHNLKSDCKLLKVAVIFRIMTANFNILRSHFEICNHVTASFNILPSHFKLWLQLSTFCIHISNYDRNMLKFAVTFGTFETISTAYWSALNLFYLILYCNIWFSVSPFEWYTLNVYHAMEVGENCILVE